MSGGFDRVIARDVAKFKLVAHELFLPVVSMVPRHVLQRHFSHDGALDTSDEDRGCWLFTLRNLGGRCLGLLSYWKRLWFLDNWCRLL